MIRRFIDAWGPQEKFDAVFVDENAVPKKECCWKCVHYVSHGEEELRVGHGWVTRITGACLFWDGHLSTRERACSHVCKKFERRDGKMREFRIKTVTVEVEKHMWVEEEV